MTLAEQLEALRPLLATTAQEEYDDWDQSGDDPLGGGGICDRVADRMGEVIVNHLTWLRISEGGQDGDDHAWVVVNDGKQKLGIDIPANVYEWGAGYAWHKKPNITILPEHVLIFDLTKERAQHA